jgi:hypothetical protein
MVDVMARAAQKAEAAPPALQESRDSFRKESFPLQRCAYARFEKRRNR